MASRIAGKRRRIDLFLNRLGCASKPSIPAGIIQPKRVMLKRMMPKIFPAGGDMYVAGTIKSATKMNGNEMTATEIRFIRLGRNADSEVKIRKQSGAKKPTLCVVARSGMSRIRESHDRRRGRSKRMRRNPF